MSSSLQLLGQRLRQDLARHLDVPEAERARVRRAILAPRRPEAGWLTWPRGLVLSAVLAAGALFVGSRGAGEQPLRFWIQERAGKLEESVTALGAEQGLRFSDGSSVVAGPHTTTRVTQVTAAGAKLALERGRLDVHVVPQEGSRWQVVAGPFFVKVTGTRFRVAWNPQDRTLVVSVSEGRVQVSGAGQPEHVLTAGSSVSLRAEGGSEVKNALEAGAPAPLPAPSDDAAPAVARDRDELGHQHKVGEPKPDWRELTTAGHYREALSRVEELGFGAQCEKLSARDLLTLASTARLAGRADLARDAYLSVRRRFASSSEGAISAFSLGRLASESGQGTVAITWFKRYLAEQPGGQLAREASGRLIELSRQTGDSAQTRALAESYLKQYPSGPHAALARSVLARP